jgi:PTS system galactitol-specific IIA component
MSEKIEISEACVDLNVMTDNREKALRHLAGLLEKQGFVDSAYAGKILEREAKYPTGLNFSRIAIAIPHSDSDYVKKSAIAIGRCPNKPMFGSMENSTEQIGVDMVVMLAMRNPERHLMILNNLMEMFTSEENCKVLLGCDSTETVCQLFKINLYEK